MLVSYQKSDEEVVMGFNTLDVRNISDNNTDLRSLQGLETFVAIAMAVMRTLQNCV
jgi:hypothetical protein